MLIYFYIKLIKIISRETKATIINLETEGVVMCHSAREQGWYWRASNSRWPMRNPLFFYRIWVKKKFKPIKYVAVALQYLQILCNHLVTTSTFTGLPSKGRNKCRFWLVTKQCSLNFIRASSKHYIRCAI